MGTYVYFSLGETDGLLTRFITDLGKFIDWFEPFVAEFPHDYPPDLLDKAIDIASRGIAALEIASSKEADLIDRLVDEYWNFCDLNGLHREKDITRSAHKWYRYAPDLLTVLPKASPVAAAYYRSLFIGRSIAQCSGHKYVSDDGVFHLSWLFPKEVSAFLVELECFEPELELHKTMKRKGCTGYYRRSRMRRVIKQVSSSPLPDPFIKIKRGYGLAF